MGLPVWLSQSGGARPQHSSKCWGHMVDGHPVFEEGKEASVWGPGRMVKCPQTQPGRSAGPLSKEWA